MRLNDCLKVSPSISRVTEYLPGVANGPIDFSESTF